MVNYFYKMGHTWQFLKSALEIISAFQVHLPYPTEKEKKTKPNFLLIYNFNYTRTLSNSDGKSLTNIPLAP